MLNPTLQIKVDNFSIGNIARSTGCYATIIGHSEDGSKTRLRLSSGARKTVVGEARAMIGIVGGGGRTDKPILKAGISYYKHKVIFYQLG